SQARQGALRSLVRQDPGLPLRRSRHRDPRLRTPAHRSELQPRQPGSELATSHRRPRALRGCLRAHDPQGSEVHREDVLVSAPLVIGLCGPARSGKTTLARHFAARGFVVVALGDRLKEHLLTLDPLVSIDLSSTRERSLRPASAIVSDNETVAFYPLSALLHAHRWAGSVRTA